MTYTYPPLLTFHTHTHTHKNDNCWVIFLTSCTDSSSWLARSGIAVLVEILPSSPTLCRSWYPDTNCWRITWSVEGSSRGLCSMPDRSLWNWLIVYIMFTFTLRLFHSTYEEVSPKAGKDLQDIGFYLSTDGHLRKQESLKCHTSCNNKPWFFTFLSQGPTN